MTWVKIYLPLFILCGIMPQNYELIFKSRLSKNVVKSYNVNKLQTQMRKLTHH